jgi:NADPH-dependent glutamate synthase beta subunit-like oxidoreductase
LRHIAIIGSGPAGYYTAEACLEAFGNDVHIDIIDQMPVPYGLIRTGVAPDHQSIKAVTRRFESVSLSDNVRFVGNVAIGRDVGIPELQISYDAVVLATGAPTDLELDIPGAGLPGVTGSAAFVGWYNGHPDFANLNPTLDGPGAVIVGNGNVALDVARILAKSRGEFAGTDIAGHALDWLDRSQIKRVTLLGRRGPHQVGMTPNELGELGRLERAQPLVAATDLPPVGQDAALESSLRKSINHLRSFAAAEPADKPIAIDFDFFARPVAIEGDGKAERVIVERTRLDNELRAVGTGQMYVIPASLVVTCIGYRTPPIDGVPYDQASGRFSNDNGRILPGLYCVGWARRGPSGTVGTNRPDGYMIADQLATDLHAGSGKAGRAGLDALLASRKVEVVTFRDWQKIESAEAARARDGAPREKFVDLSDMLAASHSEQA